MTIKISQECSSCVYYPSNCRFIRENTESSNCKVISNLNCFMNNGCKYYINVSHVKGGDETHDRKTK